MRRAALMWTGLEALISGGASFVVAFLIARLIGPGEMGIGAAVTALHVLLSVGVTALFADAIVQRQHLDDDQASSAFWASCAVGVLAAFIQLAAIWPMRLLLDDPRVMAMGAALAVPLPLLGAAGAVQGRATRLRNYRLLALRALCGQASGAALGVVIAMRAGGAWALVGQQAMLSGAGALTILAGAGWRPSWVWKQAAVRDMLRVGGPLTASTLVLHGRYRIFVLLLGGVLGKVELGQTHMAFRLAETMRELASTVMWRLLLPGMSQRQSDLAALRAGVDDALHAIGATLFPLCAAMAVGIGPLTRLLLGPGWVPSGTAAAPLVVLAAWMFLLFPGGVACVARGAPRYALRAHLAGAVLIAAGVLVVRPQTPLAAALVWIAAHAAIAPYMLSTAAQELRVPVWRTVAAGMPSLLIAAIAAIMALILPELRGTPLVMFVQRVVVAAAPMLLLTPPLWRARPASPARS